MFGKRVRAVGPFVLVACVIAVAVFFAMQGPPARIEENAGGEDGDTILVSETDLCESESHELPEGLCFYFEDFGRFNLSYLALPRAVRPTVQISETYEYSEGAGTLHITGTVTDMLKPVTEVTIDCVDYVAVAAPDNPPGGPYVSYFDVEFEFEMPQWEEDKTSFAVNASNVTRALGTDVIVLKMVNGQIEIVHHENNADAMQPLEYYYVSPIPATEGVEVAFQAKAEDGTVYDSITSVMGQVPELDARVQIAGPVMLIKTYTDESPSTFGLEPEVRSKVLFWYDDSCETLSALLPDP